MLIVKLKCYLDIIFILTVVMTQQHVRHKSMQGMKHIRLKGM